MRASLKKFTHFALLAALLFLQVHELFIRHHDDAGKPDDDCALCSTVLSQVASTPVTLAKLEVVLLPFAFKVPVLPKAAPISPVALPALLGPPSTLAS